MRNDNTMLHMKLNSAVSAFAVAAAFSVLLPPSNAYGGICFLPDCQDEDVMFGDVNMNINSDTEYCEKEGYTYYSSGDIPITLPANVRNITPKSEPVPATTII